MLKLDFSLFEQTPHLGLVLLDVPDILSIFFEQSNQPHFMCSLLKQTPHGRILENFIFRTNIIEGNLTYDLKD